jgi:hypothetical protein
MFGRCALCEDAEIYQRMQPVCDHVLRRTETALKFGRLTQPGKGVSHDENGYPVAHSVDQCNGEAVVAAAKANAVAEYHSPVLFDLCSGKDAIPASNQGK